MCVGVCGVCLSALGKFIMYDGHLCAHSIATRTFLLWTAVTFCVVCFYVWSSLVQFFLLFMIALILGLVSL